MHVCRKASQRGNVSGGMTSLVSRVCVCVCVCVCTRTRACLHTHYMRHLVPWSTQFITGEFGAKNYRNRLVFAKVIAKSLLAPFLWTIVYINILYHISHCCCLVSASVICLIIFNHLTAHNLTPVVLCHWIFFYLTVKISLRAIT